MSSLALNLIDKVLINDYLSFKKFNKHILVLSCIVFSTSSFGTEIPVYYSDYLLTADRLSKNCDVYIKDNADSLHDALDGFLKLYSDKQWEELSEQIVDLDVALYLSNLRKCTAVFKFKGGRDYYDTAYSGLILLNATYVYASEKRKKSNANVLEITEKLKNDLNRIKISVRSIGSDSIEK